MAKKKRSWSQVISDVSSKYHNPDEVIIIEEGAKKIKRRKKKGDCGC